MTMIHSVIREIADDDRAHDPWGAGMSALGAVCDVLFALGDSELIPVEAGFRPAMASSQDIEELRDDGTGENYHAHAILAAMDSTFDPDYYVFGFLHDLTVDDLEYAADVLTRYLDLVKLAGRDY